QAGGERVLTNLTRIVTTRQAQARQINTATRVGGTSLEKGVGEFDIAVDFGRLETTGTLVLDGVDDNGDRIDDYTGQQISGFDGAAESPIIAGTSANDYFGAQVAPFSAIYAVFTPDATLTEQGTSATAAVALAVYPSGYTESFRWDGFDWHGYNGRTFPSK